MKIANADECNNSFFPRLMIDGKSNAYIYTVTYIGHCVLHSELCTSITPEFLYKKQHVQQAI